MKAVLATALAFATALGAFAWLDARRASGARAARALPGASAEAGRLAAAAWGCGTCHTIPGIRGARGTVGPDLTDFGRRDLVAGILPNGPDALVTWLVSPRVATPGVGGGLAVVGASNGHLAAVDVASGAPRWTRTFDDHVNAAPLVADGRVYLGTTGERVLVLDAATGATLWESTVRGRVKSAVAGGDGVVYVLSEPRHLIAFEPAAP